jgi:hypothetical protein
VSPEASLVDESKLQEHEEFILVNESKPLQHKEFILVNESNGLNLYIGPDVESYVPENAQIDVRTRGRLTQLYIVGAEKAMYCWL